MQVTKLIEYNYMNYEKYLNQLVTVVLNLLRFAFCDNVDLLGRLDELNYRLIMHKKYGRWQIREVVSQQLGIPQGANLHLWFYS